MITSRRAFGAIVHGLLISCLWPLQEAREHWEQALRLFSVNDDLALLERLLTLLEGRSGREPPTAAPPAAAAPLQAPTSIHSSPATSVPAPKASGPCCS